jgi:hypothetical protein
MQDSNTTGIRDRISGALWQVYYNLQAVGLISPLIPYLASWRHLPRRKIIKRILIAFGIFWVFDIAVGTLIVFGFLPCPPNFAGCPSH